jgi:hypothetical protein
LILKRGALSCQQFFGTIRNNRVARFIAIHNKLKMTALMVSALVLAGIQRLSTFDGLQGGRGGVF